MFRSQYLALSDKNASGKRSRFANLQDAGVRPGQTRVLEERFAALCLGAWRRACPVQISELKRDGNAHVYEFGRGDLDQQRRCGHKRS